MAKILNSQKKQVFTCDAPEAKSVELVGDFTHWQNNAIPLKKQKNGTWKAGVELPVGIYQYRFLVDGQWRDDSQCDKRVPNAFGTYNAVREIAAT